MSTSWPAASKEDERYRIDKFSSSSGPTSDIRICHLLFVLIKGALPDAELVREKSGVHQDILIAVIIKGINNVFLPPQ